MTYAFVFFSGLWITCIIYNISAIKVVVMLDYLDNSDKRKGLTPSLQMHFFQFIFNMKWVELHIELQILWADFSHRYSKLNTEKDLAELWFSHG